MSVFDLLGKVAIVTGGASGIGFSIAQTLAQANANVILADISANGERAAAKLREQGWKAEYVQTDVTRSADAEQVVSHAVTRYGGLDILINNAGIYPRAGLLDTSEAMWDQVMSINLKGMFIISKAAVPAMIERGGGAIVNLGSSHSDVGLPELFAYSVSKGGVVTLTRNLAGALTGKRIRVNCVNPGWVATEKEIAERAANGQSVEWLQETGKRLPLGRMQTGEDTAAAVLYLVSDQASQVTGQLIHVDGGKSVAMAFDDRSVETD